MSLDSMEFIVIFVSILALLLLLIFYRSSKKRRTEDMPVEDDPYRVPPDSPSGGYGSSGISPGGGYSGGAYPGGGYSTGGYRSAPPPAGTGAGSPDRGHGDKLGKAESLEKTSYVWSTGEEKYAGKAVEGSDGKGLKKGRFSSASTKKNKEEKVLDSDIEEIYAFHYSRRLRICPYCGSENDVSNPVCESCKENLR